ncbi:integrase [Elizabethkingia anophelis]|nr:integrase [Elizabethkingia anophelis]MDV3830397.1 integrase [Elizabethkingia anophelis]MDV4078189.1 integrase [Elizabethkingia anophelis]
MMKITFIVKNPKQGKNTIHIRVRMGRKIDLFLSTKETTELEDWNSRDGLLFESITEFKGGKSIEKRGAESKKRIQSNKNVNYRLLELRKSIEDNYRNNNILPTSEWLKGIVYPEIKENEEVVNEDFINYCSTFIEDKGNTISDKYITKINSIKAIIERYLSYKKQKHLSIPDINNDFKRDFEKYCLGIEGYALNYFERNFKFIKTILYHAQANGYVIYSGLNKLKCKTEKTMFQILTPEELSIIERETFSDEHLETAKDWLLISCYTGQRVSDFMRFNVSMIEEKNVKNKKRFFIEFTQEKTKKQILLPLHEKVVEILKKREWNFPRKMSEARYNEHIKKVCEYVGIDEMVEGSLSMEDSSKFGRNKRRKVASVYPKYKLISSHIGRRSFASNNFGKIPTPLLMVATGHSTPTMLMKYIGKIDEQQSLALAEYL